MENVNKLLRDVKIAKRHNAGSVFIGLICLLAVAAPILLWIPNLPWLQMAVKTVPEQSSWSFQYQAGQIDLTPLNLIKNLFSQADEPTKFVIDNAVTSSCLLQEHAGLNPHLMHSSYYVIKETLAEAGIWYLASAVLAVVLFVQGLVLLFRGRLHNNFSVVLVAGFYALSCGMLLCSAWRLGYGIGGNMLKVFQEQGVDGANLYFYKLWPNYIIMGIGAGLFVLILIVYLCTLCRKYYPEDLIVIGPKKPNPYETDDGVTRNTLPRGLRNIGNHAFYRNTHLEIANLEYGVKQLGTGAFSNCIRLKIVDLPVTVQRINSNCFFNCAQLKRINYGGTKKQWRKVSRGTNWLANAGTTTVICSDGAIAVNPFH